MAGSKKAIIVGIPGVGKTTVIARAAEVAGKYRKVRVAIFGSLMFDEAQKKGLKTRDEIRRLPVDDQRRLQETAARRISEMNEEVVIIDTHLFVNTREGYYPGLPMTLLDIIKPTNLLLVSADPDEIIERRRADPSRNRDPASSEDILRELEISKSMAASCSVITGAPFAIIMNNDGRQENAASEIARILGGTS